MHNNRGKLNQARSKKKQKKHVRFIHVIRHTSIYSFFFKKRKSKNYYLLKTFNLTEIAITANKINEIL